MPVKVNCTSFTHPNRCLHQAAPRRWLGTAQCIVWIQHSQLSAADPRPVPGCMLCTPHPKPEGLPYVPQAGTVEGGYQPHPGPDRYALASRDEAAHQPRCTYPECSCPYDAPANPNWCARGYPKK